MVTRFLLMLALVGLSDSVSEAQTPCQYEQDMVQLTGTAWIDLYQDLVAADKRLATARQALAEAIATGAPEDELALLRELVQRAEQTVARLEKLEQAAYADHMQARWDLLLCESRTMFIPLIPRPDPQFQ